MQHTHNEGFDLSAIERWGRLYQIKVDLKRDRIKAGLTTQQAADLVYRERRTWQAWEDLGPNGNPPDMYRVAAFYAGLREMGIVLEAGDE